MYTRTIYKLFKEQLKLTTKYVYKVAENDTFLVEVDDADAGSQRRTFVVHYKPDENKLSCSCKLWEFGGILCAHMLKILTALHVRQIPPNYILKRWTRNAQYVELHHDKGKGLVTSSSTKLLRFNA